MATHGYGPFRRFLLGSVTAKVLHDAACPVWTGPHLEQAPSYRNIGFHRIVCAIDLAQRSRAVLEWAGRFAREFDAELDIVHVLPHTLVQLGGIYFDRNGGTTPRRPRATRSAGSNRRPGRLARC